MTRSFRNCCNSSQDLALCWVKRSFSRTWSTLQCTMAWSARSWAFHHRGKSRSSFGKQWVIFNRGSRQVPTAFHQLSLRSHYKLLSSITTCHRPSPSSSFIFHPTSSIFIHRLSSPIIHHPSSITHHSASIAIIYHCHHHCGW